MGSIVPSAFKLAIRRLPVNSIGARLDCLWRRYDKFKGLQGVTIGQDGSDPDEALLQSFLAFSYLEGTYHWGQ